MIVAVRRLLVGLALAWLGGAAAASAQGNQTASPAASMRIAFVNARAVLTGMSGYAKAESTYTKELGVVQAEAQKLQAAMDSAVASYQQSQAMMTPSARTAREKVLSAQNDSMTAKLNALQEKIQNRERELLEPMQQRLKAVIDGIRAEGNYAAVIDLGNPNIASFIVSYDKALDITIQVARRLQGS